MGGCVPAKAHVGLGHKTQLLCPPFPLHLQLTKFHQEQKAKLDAHIKPGGQRNAVQVCTYTYTYRVVAEVASGVVTLLCAQQDTLVLSMQVLCNSMVGGAAAAVACATQVLSTHQQSNSAQPPDATLQVIQLAAWCAFLVSNDMMMGRQRAYVSWGTQCTCKRTFQARDGLHLFSPLGCKTTTPDEHTHTRTCNAAIATAVAGVGPGAA